MGKIMSLIYSHAKKKHEPEIKPNEKKYWRDLNYLRELSKTIRTENENSNTKEPNQ